MNNHYGHPHGGCCNDKDQPLLECPIYTFATGVIVTETKDKLGRLICNVTVDPNLVGALNKDTVEAAILAMDASQTNNVFGAIVGNMDQTRRRGLIRSIFTAIGTSIWSNPADDYRVGEQDGAGQPAGVVPISSV